MEEEEFKKLCPNLYKAMQENMRTEYYYGLPYRTHTPLLKYDLIANEEKSMIVYKYTWSEIPITLHLN